MTEHLCPECGREMEKIEYGGVPLPYVFLNCKTCRKVFTQLSDEKLVEVYNERTAGNDY